MEKAIKNINYFTLSYIKICFVILEKCSTSQLKYAFESEINVFTNLARLNN